MTCSVRRDHGRFVPRHLGQLQCSPARRQSAKSVDLSPGCPSPSGLLVNCMSRHPTSYCLFRAYAGLTLLLAHVALGDDLAWNAEGAARFLSNRQQAWLDFTVKRAEKRGQSQNAACASCHTVLPSLLAEPAIEQALGRQEPSPYAIIFEDRIRDRVMRPEVPQNARFGYLRSAEPIIYAL